VRLLLLRGTSSVRTSGRGDVRQRGGHRGQRAMVRVRVPENASSGLAPKYGNRLVDHHCRQGRGHARGGVDLVEWRCRRRKRVKRIRGLAREITRGRKKWNIPRLTNRTRREILFQNQHILKNMPGRSYVETVTHSSYWTLVLTQENERSRDRQPALLDSDDLLVRGKTREKFRGVLRVRCRENISRKKIPLAKTLILFFVSAQFAGPQREDRGMG
jgi:hypothetical protein